MKSKVAAGIITIFVGILVVMQLVNNIVVEYYSPGFMTESITEARIREVLISQPTLKSNVIRWGKSDYPIREAWIEQATRIKYDWIFFRRVIPTGYRLILRIGETGKPPGKNFSDYLYERKALICNNSIFVTTSTSGRISNEVFMYSEFSSPVPSSIQCVVKKPT